MLNTLLCCHHNMGSFLRIDTILRLRAHSLASQRESQRRQAHEAIVDETIFSRINGPECGSGQWLHD